MLDAIKGLTGNSKAQKQQSDDLQSLIAAAKEERSALSTMLTQLSMRSSKLNEVSKALQQVEEKAGATTGKLDDLGKRLDGLEGRAKAFGEVESALPR
jgi:DNA repair ATPase RecN